MNDVIFKIDLTESTVCTFFISSFISSPLVEYYSTYFGESFTLEPIAKHLIKFKKISTHDVILNAYAVFFHFLKKIFILISISPNVPVSLNVPISPKFFAKKLSAILAPPVVFLLLYLVIIPKNQSQIGSSNSNLYIYLYSYSYIS